MKVTHYRQYRPDFVLDNIDSMEQIMDTCGFKIRQVANLTGILPSFIREYKLGYSLPSKTNYNKLAAFFDWEVWL